MKIPFLTAWLRRRKAERDRKAWMDGMIYGYIEASKGNTQQVESHLDMSRQMGDYDMFDTGAQAGLVKWRTEQLKALRPRTGNYLNQTMG